MVFSMRRTRALHSSRRMHDSQDGGVSMVRSRRALRDLLGVRQ